MHDTVMNGPGGAPLGQPGGPGGAGGPPGSAPPGAASGRASVPSTPQMASRQASMSGGMMSGPGPGPGQPGGPGGMPMGPGYPMHMHPSASGGGGGGMAAGPGEMGPPPLPREGYRGMPMELGGFSATAAAAMGAGMGGPTAHAYGILRLLQFSSRMRGLSGHDEEKWAPIIAEHFTENATLSFRAQKGAKQPLNGFVKLPFQLLGRFFATLSQSNINRMSLILDGAMESQDNHEYTVYCPTARWPMHYDNGYILELNGVLRAKCRPVPAQHLSQHRSNGTPQMAHNVPNGIGSSPSGSSSNNMHNSPAIQPAGGGGGGIPNGAESNNNPLQHLPWMVKIDELSFDSNSVSKLLDFARLQGDKIPRVPENIYGVPTITMRMIEFSEGTQAMEPMMEFSKRSSFPPLDAFKEYVKNMQATKSEVKEEEMLYVDMGGQRMSIIEATLAAQAGGGRFVDGPPQSSLSDNVTQRMTNMVDHSMSDPANSASEPSVSPSIPPKTPGKKNTAPGSPTKASSSTQVEKEKGGGKRKNTTDEGGPPSKQRRTTRKGSKAN